MGWCRAPWMVAARAVARYDDGCATTTVGTAAKDCCAERIIMATKGAAVVTDEPDVIQVIWDVFRAGGSQRDARLAVAGRRVYISENPRMSPAEREQIARDIERGARLQEVQRRYKRSRATIYRIRQQLRLG